MTFLAAAGLLAANAAVVLVIAWFGLFVSFAFLLIALSAHSRILAALAVAACILDGWWLQFWNYFEPAPFTDDWEVMDFYHQWINSCHVWAILQAVSIAALFWTVHYHDPRRRRRLTVRDIASPQIDEVN